MKNWLTGIHLEKQQSAGSNSNCNYVSFQCGWGVISITDCWDNSSRVIDNSIVYIVLW